VCASVCDCANTQPVSAGVCSIVPNSALHLLCRARVPSLWLQCVEAGAWWRSAGSGSSSLESGQRGAMNASYAASEASRIHSAKHSQSATLADFLSDPRDPLVSGTQPLLSIACRLNVAHRSLAAVDGECNRRRAQPCGRRSFSNAAPHGAAEITRS
jgi:hypothetical protein